MRGQVTRLLKHMLDWLFPPRCIFCRRLSPTADVLLCKDCERDLPEIDIREQKKILPNLDFAVAPLYYEGKVRESFLRYKFQSAGFYAGVYANFLSKCVDENEINCDIITWAPLSRTRRRMRGYDQAELLARETARYMGGVECVRLLRKIRNNKAQSKLDTAALKEQNVRGLYVVTAPELVIGKRVLLVDDILTTGSTVKECARVLKAVGAKSVCAVTLARRRA